MAGTTKVNVFLEKVFWDEAVFKRKHQGHVAREGAGGDGLQPGTGSQDWDSLQRVRQVEGMW